MAHRLTFLNTKPSTTPTPSERITIAKQIANTAAWKSLDISTMQFELQAFVKYPLKLKGDVLTIYIEGDGHAWANSQTPSDNPSPTNPIALRLAIQDPSKTVAYLGRPCQYLDLNISGASQTCHQRYWTNRRFSPEVIASMNEAIDQLKEYYQAEQLIVVGYSGGATIALLTSIQRNDVAKIVTVAGNVDTDAWVQYHSLNPLIGSLNPANFSSYLKNIPQILYVGNKDDIVPLEVTQSYVNRFPRDHQPQVVLISEYGHVCCWIEGWNKLIGHH
jgi:pimeloyl-ACP methyl ester carboxylesterase